jgi:NAD(P)-dependent dehydrogenase (short-subunit alcohol dehydrogenase family)
MAPYTPTTTADEVASGLAGSIKNNTVLITGVSPWGLGAEFAITIAKHFPALLILANRNLAKAQKTAQDIATVAPSVPIRILQLDLNSQAQVRKSAEEVNSYKEHIDVLVNNAGIMAGPYQLTEDGIDSQFGINHIGHFLFTNLILNKLVNGIGNKPARVINVSSDGYRLGPVRFDDWNFDVSFS